jgi:hypothetical protein
MVACLPACLPACEMGGLRDVPERWDLGRRCSRWARTASAAQGKKVVRSLAVAKMAKTTHQ